MFYFEILSVNGTEIMEQGSIMLFSISEFHQYAVQIARLWKFSQFIRILYHVLHVVLLL